MYAYGALRALAAWRPARFDLTLDGRARTVVGYSVATANAKAYGGGMLLAPDAELDDGLLDVVWTDDLPKWRFARNLPRVFKGTHVAEPEVHVARGARGARRRRPALHRLRRRRPDRRAPGHDDRRPGRPARPRPRAMTHRAKVAAARAAGALSRRTGRGATSLPGKVLLRLEPRAIARLSARLRDGSVVLSATNGKTTTAAMVAAILERRGVRLVHNRAGANMAGGVASALLDARGRGDLGLFEVDELWLDRVVAQLAPRAILLANLFRDQLDRFGELEAIADRWAAVAAGAAAAGSRLVLNADDPLVAGLAPEAVLFGVQDTSLALPGLQHAADSTHCRRCGAPLRYTAILLGHLGHYACPNGDFARPDPTVVARDVRLDGVRSARFTLATPDGERAVALPLPGLYNVYNALAAAALATTLGTGLDAVVAGLEAVAPAFGRAETVRLGARDMTLLLVKNPAGLNEVIRTLALEPPDLDVLGVLNDRTADGRDVSWVWDADLELLAPRIARMVCAGTRAAELAVRMKYAGVAPERLVVAPDLPRALDAARDGAAGPLYALPTYTAMLELRSELERRGVAGSSWA